MAFLNLTYFPFSAKLLLCLHCFNFLMDVSKAMHEAESKFNVSEPINGAEYLLDNEFILGGLFPVHAKGSGEENACGKLLEDKGIQRLEAMFYAIDAINNDKEFSKISLGATIMDTCSSDSHALEKTLEFLKVGDCEVKGKLKRRVTAVIGASNSPVSESVASILRLFKIPQVSYASTSEELDNRHKYRYFFRVVPSDRFQIDAMVDILKKLKWNYISTVGATGGYGEKALQKLHEKVANGSDNICFSTKELLPREPADIDYENVIKKLLTDQKARAVVVFLDEDKLRRLLIAAKRKNALNHFLWLGSDSWGAKKAPIEDYEFLVDGAITLLPKRHPIEGFDEYFLSLKPNINNRNPWFREFWQNRFKCAFKKRNSAVGSAFKRHCTGNEDLKGSYKQEGLVPKVVDSVYAIAHALKALCAKETQCLANTITGRQLKDAILEVEFNSSQGHNIVVQFDSEKIQANYTIYQFRRVKDSPKNEYKYEYKYERIGEWNSQSGLAMFEEPTAPTSGKLGQSYCSESCQKGQERFRNQQRSCCWTCRPCEPDYYLEDENSRCKECPAGEYPTEDKKACKILKAVYMGNDWGSPWTFIPCSFSCLGILSTFAVLLVFLLYRNTPLIKAAGRELCYVMLVGVLCCYIFTFVVASEPTRTSCGVLRIGLGLGLSICYSAIFTKTNRISRIFNRRLSTIKRPSYISPISQLVICFCLILIQLTLTVMWLIITPPTVNGVEIEKPKIYVLTCGIDTTSVLLGLMFNMMLVILCTVYAYKTRNIPANFNEAKYISFTMYSSCIVWLAFIAIFSSTHKDLQAQSTILCMSVSMSGTVVLLCLFFPKLYIVLLKPHKNVHNPTTVTSSASTIDPLGAVRFVRTDPGANNLPPSSSSSTHNSYCNVDKNSMCRK